MDTGVSSYLFDSAVVSSWLCWPGVARRRLTLLLLRQIKVREVHVVGVRTLRKAKLCEHQKALRQHQAGTRALVDDIEQRFSQ